MRHHEPPLQPERGAVPAGRDQRPADARARMGRGENPGHAGGAAADGGGGDAADGDGDAERGHGGEALAGQDRKDGRNRAVARDHRHDERERAGDEAARHGVAGEGAAGAGDERQQPIGIGRGIGLVARRAVTGEPGQEQQQPGDLAIEGGAPRAERPRGEARQEIGHPQRIAASSPKTIAMAPASDGPADCHDSATVWLPRASSASPGLSRE